MPKSIPEDLTVYYQCMLLKHVSIGPKTNTAS